MEKYIVDFTGCKNLDEIHAQFKPLRHGLAAPPPRFPGKAFPRPRGDIAKNPPPLRGGGFLRSVANMLFGWPLAAQDKNVSGSTATPSQYTAKCRWGSWATSRRAVAPTVPRVSPADTVCPADTAAGSARLL